MMAAQDSGFLSSQLLDHLRSIATPVPEIPGLTQIGAHGGLETIEALRFLTELFREVKGELDQVLQQRHADREFLDARILACSEVGDDRLRVIGLQDGHGRIVFGPLTEKFNQPGGKPVAPLPTHLQGPHVTLFGPPDTAKMAINAMNAYHRRTAAEPALVSELLGKSPWVPFWGADDEDSKTPLRQDLIEAGQNLTACMDGTLSVEGYALAKDHLAVAIKRFPGLALPCTFLFVDGEPVPLHLYDFALHLFRNWNNPRALSFYVPKLETEEEAAYVHRFVSAAERRIQTLHPQYALGTVRLMIVLENPRAILRAHEILDALHPYFAGASLGWHDYLASTARLFKNDPQYRIPVKADPEIVIKHIQASHRLVADVVGSRGGVKVGGMYGILPQSGDPRSLHATLRGFIRDVVTQFKRDLNGFWVAHPDFVRLGLALVEAWRERQFGNPAVLRDLVTSLLPQEYHQETLEFIDGPDASSSAPRSIRTLLVADLAQSATIANNDPEEVRYNVFQSLQYLTDWLSGNGCVALPTHLTTVLGEIPVRVMDDLATAERSRWEVWHEIHHGRFALENLVRIAYEEMNFIRRDLSDSKKIVQVKWTAESSKWYPVALHLMLKLMTDENPVEFATQLLLPFTVEKIREAPDPMAELRKIDASLLKLRPEVQALHHFFEACGSTRFARTLASQPVPTRETARATILSFSKEEVIEAASFHGDIGQSRTTLDSRAAGEQALVASDTDQARAELRALGEQYKARFGFKFLISAQGKTSEQIKAALAERLGNSAEMELDHARQALWEIARKRLSAMETPLESFAKQYGIVGASITINATQDLYIGERVRAESSATSSFPVSGNTLFQLASLSKTLATAFALEYFRRHGISLQSTVHSILAQTASPYRIPGPWGDQVTLEHCLNHSALSMHYVNGISGSQMPTALQLLQGAHGYAPIEVRAQPGTQFGYSGGGFIVIEHLLDALEEVRGGSLPLLLKKFARELGCDHLSFDPLGREGDEIANGYLDSGESVPGGMLHVGGVHVGRLHFPSFAAGALSTSGDMARFLQHLTNAFHSLEGSGPISHETAVRMLQGSNTGRDLGSLAFMGCSMGLGVFTLEGGENRFAVHQGANEGFRALYLHCFSGPDRGKGFVILANGDNRAVPFIAKTAQWLLRHLEIRGVNPSRFISDFDSSKISQEQIVNLGYKTLLFDAFEPDLPPAIQRTASSPKDPRTDRNLAIGARIVEVSNQKFARAENLISPYLPTFDPELFCRQGKVMDSWESARHNPNLYDRVLLQLKEPSIIRQVSLSTRFHDGNHPQFVEVLGKTLGTNSDEQWIVLVPKREAAGHAYLETKAASDSQKLTHVEVRMYPDGGLTRLGLFSDLPKSGAPDAFVRYPDAIPKSRKPLTIPCGSELPVADPSDLANLAQGGRVLSASNEHYGPAAQVISPYPPLHMFDGLESARSREPGHHEEVVIGLRSPARISRIVLDFTFFVNNNPREVSIEGRLQSGAWSEIVARTHVKPFAGNRIAFEISAALTGPLDQFRFKVFPDGGINRIRIISTDPVA
jgi:allantoicase/malate synthase/CubicO group peptidase (beta-lactamase class C family)